MVMNLQLLCTPVDHLAHKHTGKGAWPVVATDTEQWASICLWKVSYLLWVGSWVTAGFFGVRKH